jgi:hypothetical protein
MGQSASTSAGEVLTDRNDIIEAVQDLRTELEAKLPPKSYP